MVLEEVTKILVTNLNNIIDINFYPTNKTRLSNFKHRPIGIGVQGLADTYFKMNMAFTSNEAKQLNKEIFETIYFAGLTKSYEISKERQENMLYLQEQYKLNNWTFTNSDDDCRSYNIYNNSEASSINAKNNDEKIAKLLDNYKPIKAEIDNLEHNIIGAYSSFKGSPLSEGTITKRC